MSAILTSLLTLVMSVAVYAQSDTNIQVVGKDQFKGQQVYALHALANQKLRAMGEDPKNFELMGVNMRAKSRNGQGQVTLIVGSDRDTKRVPDVGGGDLFFEITAPWAYKTIRWDISNDPGRAGEAWRLRFNGDIRIREINLELSSRASGNLVRIQLNDTLLTGNSTIHLRKELQRMGMQTQNRDLKKVILLAKSAAGNGLAQLQIGSTSKATQNVKESRSGYDFQSNAMQSYNQIQWQHGGSSNGAWQIDLRGRIKVKTVIVQLQ